MFGTKAIVTETPPTMYIQETSKEARMIAEAALEAFSLEHFQGADLTMMLDWGSLSKPWVFTDEGGEAPILKKERARALIEVRSVPHERIKNFNFIERMTSLVKRLGDKFENLDEGKRPIAVGTTLKGQFKVLEDFTTEQSSYKTFLVFNETFKRLMIVRTTHDGQFREMKDVIVGNNMWMRISDHPNIQTMHYIEAINKSAVMACEYVAAISIQRRFVLTSELVENSNLLRPGESNYITNLTYILKIINLVTDALEYAHLNSMLHLCLAPSKVLWTVQDLTETQVYRIADPMNRSGIILTEFGNLLMFDAQNQNYKLPSTKHELDYVNSYW